MPDDEERLPTMGAKTDQRKGQGKEALGRLTGDKDLESDGKTDRRAGEAKETVGAVRDAAEQVTDKAQEKAGEIIDETKDALTHKS
jgi:uncharacterized protein YjbJ (UPF0337 family)